jgi:hypothetical protein
MAFAVETVSLFKSQKSHWHKKKIHNTYTERERGGERERERGREGWNHNHPTKQLGKQREKETES